MTETGVGPDAFQAKNALLDMAEKECRQAMTLFAPQTENTLGVKYAAVIPRDDQIGIRFCRKCNPPPQIWTCVFCDREFDEQWKLKAHYVYQPEYCKQRADKKVSTWANKS